MTLCDASPLFALIDTSQAAANARCKAVLPTLSKPLITTWSAFTEAMYLVNRAGRNVWIDIGYAVAFTDVVKHHLLPPEATLEVIVDGTDLNQLAKKVVQVMQFWASQSTGEFSQGKQLIEDLVRLIAPVMQLPNPLSIQVAEEEREIIRLTDEQFHILNVLARRRRAVFNGCAGSGKTMLAVEKARRLTAEGFRTLLCCHNEPLARYLKQVTADITGLTIETFFGLAETLTSAAGNDVEALKRLTLEKRVYEYAEALSDAIQTRPDLRFDAIIVDDGQDFIDTWWTALEFCLNESNILYVFYDENQCLGKGGFIVPDSREPYVLEKNVRNTRCIHRTMLPFFRDASVSVPIGPDGRDVEQYECPTPKDVTRTISKILHRLLREERLRTADIAVLTMCPVTKSELYKLRVPCGVTLVPEPLGVEDVLLSSVEEFKGLERPVIIVAELTDNSIKEPNMNARLYVALSRARNHMIVLGTSEALEFMNNYDAQYVDAQVPSSKRYAPYYYDYSENTIKIFQKLMKKHGEDGEGIENG